VGIARYGSDAFQSEVKQERRLVASFFNEWVDKAPYTTVAVETYLIFICHIS